MLTIITETWKLIYFKYNRCKSEAKNVNKKIIYNDKLKRTSEFNTKPYIRETIVNFQSRWVVYLVLGMIRKILV